METKTERHREVFEVNTKGLCLLCLKDGCSVSLYSEIDGEKNSSFKIFLRYLKINTYNICNFSSSFLQSMDALEDADIVVSLCKGCSDTIEMFSQLYQDMELIRLRLDSCLQILHDSMQRAKSCETRVSEYQRRMRSRNMYEMFNASVADNLRNEAMKKCSKKVETLVPRVSLFYREQKSLASFGFPSTVGLRKLPGPKSKTLISGNSKLKSLLNRDGNMSLSSQNQSLLYASLLGNGDGGKKEDLNKTDMTSKMVTGDGLECSEEFIVKVEPILDDDHDMSKFHNENEEENESSLMHNNFELGNASAIANFDGQLIGHFLGGNEETKTLSQNENADMSQSSAAKPFSCTFCRKSFYSVASLGGHMHVHKNRQTVKKKKTISKQSGSKGTIESLKQGVLKKKKSKCSICKKIFISKDSYRVHFRRFHKDVKGPVPPASGNGGKTFDCEICGKRFSQYTVHRTHMVSLHSAHVFSKYLPPGTTQDQFNAAIQAVFAEHQEILDPNKKKSKLYGCPFCPQQVYPHPSHLRLHLLRNHLDKVLNMLQNILGNGNVEIVSGEEATANLPSDLGVLLDLDGEEIDPQPILLSDVFSLSEEAGDDNEGDLLKETQSGVANADPLLDI